MLSIDYNIQKYAEQLALETIEKKGAKSVSIISMNPNNGEIYCMVNVPEYDLNDPYHGETDMLILNSIWRNGCINDTYEPGSAFKVITGSGALEYGAVNLNTGFYCSGYKIVNDRRIRCSKTEGHGAENFITATMNSCNPAFIEIGLRLGANNLYEYMSRLGFMEKTGVDIPGEATSIMHKLDDIGNVELATVSFGQSFQITPLQLLRGISAVINGGTLVTPHFAIGTVDESGILDEEYIYQVVPNVVSKETSDNMRAVLEQVVANGGGKLGAVEGYSVGGKTATSEKLPRGNGKYIASFVGFAPVDDPQIITICIVDEPKGIYYGGYVAAPVVARLYENILPYLLDNN